MLITLDGKEESELDACPIDRQSTTSAKGLILSLKAAAPKGAACRGRLRPINGPGMVVSKADLFHKGGLGSLVLARSNFFTAAPAPLMGLTKDRLLL